MYGILISPAEYDRQSIDAEYRRVIAKGTSIAHPEHYDENDDPEMTPIITWIAHANTLYTNWLNYYVYQVTPYDMVETPV